MLYEDFVKTTDISNHNPIFYVFGLIEEAGEIAGICKRAMRGDYGQGVKRDTEVGNWKMVFENESVKKDIMKEDGDNEWYKTRLGQIIGYTRAERDNMNQDKLMKRKSTGTLMGHGDNREELNTK